MTLQDFLMKIGLSEFSFWGILLFLASIGIELTPKIKWNPWTALFKWIGEKFNTHIDSKLETVRGDIKVLDGKVTKVQNELTRHISESEAKALQDTQRDILEFGNACMNGRKHTREQFDFMIAQCDRYEEYIQNNHVKNGVIEAAIKEIRRLYDERLHNNDFLKEGEDPEEHIRKRIVDEFIAGIHKYQDACPARSEKMAALALEKAKAARAARTRKQTILKETEESEEKSEATV